MQNDHFSLHRMRITLLLTIKSDFWLLVLISVALSTGAVVLSFFTGLEMGIFYRHDLFFVASLALLIALVVGNFFSWNRQKSKSQEYLLVPASSWEKYLSNVIHLFILLPLVHLAIYWILSTIGNTIGEATTTTFFIPLNLHNIDLATPYLLLEVAVFANGALFFRKFPMFITLGLIGGLGGLFMYHKAYWVQKIIDANEKSSLYIESTPIISTWGVLGLAGLLMAMLFFQLKEKEA